MNRKDANQCNKRLAYCHFILDLTQPKCGALKQLGGGNLYAIRSFVLNVMRH